jgi:hypothetical protein
MDKESCESCVYCCDIFKYPLFQEVLTKACLYHPLTDRSVYVLEVGKYDRCECYKKREE